MEGKTPIKRHVEETAKGSEVGAEGSQRKKPKTNLEEVKLSVGNTVIVADRRQLTASSPFFAALLRFHADTDFNAVSLKPPENTHLGTFLAILHSLTNTEVQLHISATNVWDCILLSRYFQLEDMEEECYHSLRKLRKLRTLTMDELVRLWRNGNACDIAKVTALALVTISLNMDSVEASTEFLDLTADELVALLCDDGFLPLVEAHVCKAAIAWFEHDPPNRKQPLVVERILAQLVCDDSIYNLLPSLSWKCRLPEQMPKRAVNSDGYENPAVLFLDHPEQVLDLIDDKVNPDQASGDGSSDQAGDDGSVDESDGGSLDQDDAKRMVAGNYAYYLEDPDLFYRIDSNTKEREWLSSVSTGRSRLESYRESEEESSPYHSAACLVKLPDGDRIGCIASYWQRTRILMEDVEGSEEYDQEYETFDELKTTIQLYDIARNVWRELPSLPCPRIDAAMVQCGTFLYVIGGREQEHYETGLVRGHHCYRLDLTSLTTRHCGVWERIADLNAPRTEHDADVRYGRIIVHGGQTQIAVDNKGSKRFEDARWSEAYDTTMDTWTIFQPAP